MERRERENRAAVGATASMRMAGRVLSGMLLLLPGALLIDAETAAAARAWPSISLALRAEGLAQPVQVTHAGDGSGTLYVVEQPGRVRTLRNGNLGATPFLDIDDRVVAGGERGLLGIAFPPGYPAKKTFYVNYTRKPDGATVIARYRVTGDPGIADPASEEIVLVVEQPFANHNGGQIAFGPDGLLYIGMGDGGSGGDPQGNAQNPASLLGKMLRVDVESGAVPYAIPATNPFVGQEGVRGEIWATGLRNPWRFSFDRMNGDLYVGDVGQASFEEVDFQPFTSAGGENYGWNVMEGNHCYGGGGCDTAGLVIPVAEYDHSQGCSITGGTVYRGGAYPEMEGIYLYGDFCSGRIWGLARDGPDWQNALLRTSSATISSFGEDEAGNLFLTDYAGGAVYEIVAGNSAPSPPALLSPQDGQAGLPSEVTFRWNSSVDPDGDAVTYLFFLDTDPSFAGAVPVALPASTRQPVPAGSGGGNLAFLAAGIALAACRRRPKGLQAAAGLLIASAMLLASVGPGCGGGGSGSSVAASITVAHTESGLSPDTTYYWKVVAGDGMSSSGSGTRTFSTAPP